MVSLKLNDIKILTLKIERLNQRFPSCMQTEILKVTGMTCGCCVHNFTKTLLAVAGISNATVSLTEWAAQVNFDAARTSIPRIKSAISASDYVTGDAAPANGSCR